jgi:hypothetical protein
MAWDAARLSDSQDNFIWLRGLFWKLKRLYDQLRRTTIPVPCSVGDKVRDDLTRQEATVIGIQMSEGNCDGKKSIRVWGIWLDNAYLGGGRHPWEISGGNWDME